MLSDVRNTNGTQGNARRSWLPAFLKPFFKAEDGNATVETVLWMPFFVALFTLIVDGTMIFNNHSNVLRIVHDANRAFSVGHYESGPETAKMIMANAAHISSNMKVETVVSNGIIVTVAKIPVADLDMTGLFGGMSGATLTVNAQHFLEL